MGTVGLEPHLLCFPSISWNGSLEVLNNVTQSHWSQFGLARLHVLILERALEMEQQCQGRGSLGWVCLWVQNLSQSLQEGSGAPRALQQWCLGRIPSGRTLWCHEVPWPLLSSWKEPEAPKWE